MPKPLHEFYLLPVYPDRETYDNQPGENADAPLWDGTRKLKHWVDPNPKNVIDFGIGLGQVAIYDAAIEMAPNGTFAVGPDGQPKVSKMSLKLDVAKTLNFLPAKGIVPTEQDLGGGPLAKIMVANASQTESIPLALPPGARVRWSPGLGAQAPIVYLAGEPLPEEQGAVGQANTLGQVLRIVQQIAQKVGVV